MLDDRLMDLVNSFPTLAQRDVRGINDVSLIAQNISNSSGTRAAAWFILSVWNHERFDLKGAWGAWDLDHRAAWKAWAADPWWA